MAPRRPPPLMLRGWWDRIEYHCRWSIGFSGMASTRYAEVSDPCSVGLGGSDPECLDFRGVMHDGSPVWGIYNNSSAPMVRSI